VARVSAAGAFRCSSSSASRIVTPACNVTLHQVKERTDEINHVLQQGKAVKAVCESTMSHLKEMQRLKQAGGKV
jgi:hypothetical protein